ncbi:histidine triad nucleotide-binding protein [bacterium]|nr:histidine triad nucleotide-binding protein [bacterium]
MSDCIFCKIASKQIPSKLILENEHVVAFHDISPQAPVHVLVIPKKHVATLNDLSDSILAGEMIKAAQQVAKDLGIDKTGYRTVMNCNQEGGQTVYHLHLHVMGGRQLGGNMAG